MVGCAQRELGMQRRGLVPCVWLLVFVGATTGSVPRTAIAQSADNSEISRSRALSNDAEPTRNHSPSNGSQASRRAARSDVSERAAKSDVSERAAKSDVSERAADPEVAATSKRASKLDEAAGTDQETGEARLPPLPKPPSLQPPPAEPADSEDLDGRISRLKASDPEERAQAVRELLEVRPRLISAAVARLNALSARADRERLKRALGEIKEKASRAKRTNRENPDADYLALATAYGNPKDEAHRDLIELVALGHIFTQIGSVDAARGLIEIYVRFGEFMRADVQSHLVELKDGAVAALLEARRHKAEKIAHWAERQLDRLGKAAPGEAIRTTDYETLADILRAYGATRDPDAAKIVVSYANNERYQVREAARQAITMMGDVALWQLREAYEDVVGKRARRDWSWSRTARELFFEYDKLHIQSVAKLFEAGRAAENAGNLVEMAAAYDLVLARLPQFERGHEMAQGYFFLAEKLQRDKPDQAQVALVRVERLTNDAALRARAKSLRETLIAEQRLSEGVFDTHLLQTASDLDPSNTRAKSLLSSLDKNLVEQQSIRLRWLSSGAIALIALLAIVLILWRRPRNELAATTSRAIGLGAPGPMLDTPAVRSAPDTGKLAPNIDADSTHLDQSLQVQSDTEATQPNRPPASVSEPAKLPSEGQTEPENTHSEWYPDASRSAPTKPPRDPIEGL